MDPSRLVEHAGFVRAIARGLLADEDKVEDVLQQTWLAAIERPPRETSAIRFWLARVATNLARRRIRDDGRRARREGMTARPAESPDPRVEAEVAADRERVLRQVASAIARSRESHRTVILLHHHERLTASQIATRLGLPQETVRTRIRRALRAVRADLDRHRPGGRAAWTRALAPLAAAPPDSRASGASSSHANSVGAVTGRPARKPLLFSGRAPLLVAGVILSAVIGILAWRETPWATSDSGSERERTRAADAPRASTAAATDDSVRAASGPPSSGASSRADLSPPSPDAPSSLETVIVRAQLKAGGRPAAGVSARIVPAGDSFEDLRNDDLGLTLGADGSARVDDVAPGTYVILFDRRQPTQPFTIAAAGLPHEIVSVFDRGLTVEGTVVTPSGDTVSGAEIVLCRPNPADTGCVVARTGDDGAFVVEAIGIPALLGARADGSAPSALHAIDMGFAGTVRRSLVLGERGGCIEGRVVDPDGKPLPGAKVLVGDDFADSFENRPDGEIVTNARSGKYVTDAEGRFRTLGLEPGPTGVIALADGRAPARVEITVSTSGPTPCVLVLGAGATVFGTIEDEDGRPARGARVEVEGERFSAAGIVPSALTAADGTYRVDQVFLGSSRIVARGEGETGTAVGSVTIDETTLDRRWDATLSLDLTVRGRIADERDVPLGGFEIMLTCPNPVAGLDPRTSPRLLRRSVPSHRDGRFVFADCKDRDYRLDVVDPESRILRSILAIDGVRPSPEERPIRVADALRPSARVRGRLTAGIDGTPPRHAVVRLNWKNGPYGMPRIELVREDGSFELGPFPPGRYELAVRADGCVVTVFRNRALEPNEVADLGTIVLPLPGVLEVSLDKDDAESPGEPVVRVLDADIEYVAELRLSDGGVGPIRLAPGAYLLSVSEGQGGRIASVEHAFEIRSGETTPVRLRLTSGVPVDIRFTQPPGSEWASWVDIAIRDESDRPVFRDRLGRGNGEWLGAAALLDLDADGRLDLAAVALNGDRVVRFPGTGDGAFASPTTVSLGRTWARLIASADLDEDGQADLIVTTVDHVVFLRRDASGGFLAPVAYSVAPQTTTSLAVGDLDGDANVDVVVASSSGCGVFCTAGRVRSYFGNGRGGVPFIADTPLFGEPAAVTLVDFDEDGRLDLAVADDPVESWGFLILRGTGRGAFQRWIEWFVGTVSGPPAAADVDGNGHVDVVVSSSAASLGPPVNSVHVLLNAGLGVVGDVRRFSGYGQTVILADVTEDGLIDAVLGASDGAAVHAGLGNGDFFERGGTPLPIGPRFLATGDFSEDGRPDVLIAESFGLEARTRVLLGDGLGGFTDSSVIEGQIATTIAGDYDGDGHFDVVLQEFQNGWGPFVRFGDGEGGFHDAPAGSGPARATTLDFDEDGVQDLVMDAPTIHPRPFLGNGDGTFRGVDFSGRRVKGPLLAGDFDSDGHLDFCQYTVSPTGSPRVIEVFPGDGRGGFGETRTTVQTHSIYRGASVADFDEDGVPDLLSDSGGRTAVIVFGRGDGTFEEPTVVPHPETYLSAVAAADLNADAHADVILMNPASITVLLGDGRGGFGPHAGFRTGANPESVAPSDVDGDGDDDLVVANARDLSISVLSNDSFIAHLDCRAGNVNVAAGPVADVLFVNGSSGAGRERRVTVPRNAPVSIDVIGPPSNPAGPAQMVVWLWRTAPRPGSARKLPRGLGFVAMPTPFHPGAMPQPRYIANSIGFPVRLGAENWPGPPTSPAPTSLLPTSATMPAGFFYLQGLIRDTAGPDGRGAVTNGVELVGN